MVSDVTDATFASAVLEGSRTKPVVVDFWAEWCGPCKSLSPIIERVGASVSDAVDTYTMDVDANPATAATFGIRSIPTVIAFRDGAPADAFLGAQPEPVVRDFFQRLLPSEDDLAASGAATLPPAEAEPVLREILVRDPGHRGAIVALARLLEDPDEVRALLARIPEDEETRRIAAEADLAAGGPSDAPPVVREAMRLAAEGSHEEALSRLLDAVRAAEDGDRDAARAAMLDLFAVLGDDDPLVSRYRRELASALF